MTYTHPNYSWVSFLLRQHIINSAVIDKYVPFSFVIRKFRSSFILTITSPAFNSTSKLGLPTIVTAFKLLTLIDQLSHKFRNYFDGHINIMNLQKLCEFITWYSTVLHIQFSSPTPINLFISPLIISGGI